MAAVARPRLCENGRWPMSKNWIPRSSIAGHPSCNQHGYYNGLIRPLRRTIAYAPVHCGEPLHMRRSSSDCCERRLPFYGSFLPLKSNTGGNRARERQPLASKRSLASLFKVVSVPRSHLISA
jgi:hypothetical protein